MSANRPRPKAVRVNEPSPADLVTARFRAALTDAFATDSLDPLNDAHLAFDEARRDLELPGSWKTYALQPTDADVPGVEQIGTSSETNAVAGIKRGKRADTYRLPYLVGPNRKTYASRVVKSSSWQPHGIPPIPFGLDRLAPADMRSTRSLAVATEDLDALAVREVIAPHYTPSGFPRNYQTDSEWDVLGLPERQWETAWAVYVRQYGRVVIVAAGDPLARAAAAAVAADIPTAETVVLPIGTTARSLVAAGVSTTTLAAVFTGAVAPTELREDNS